ITASCISFVQQAASTHLTTHRKHMSHAKTASFHISGMHCASCAANIERKVKKIAGVHSASVNYANEQGTVQYDPEIAKTEHIAHAVASLGYKAHMEDGHQHADLSEQ